jgi:hypothetical protein
LALFDAALRSRRLHAGQPGAARGQRGQAAGEQNFQFQGRPSGHAGAQGPFQCLVSGQQPFRRLRQAAFLETLQHLSEAGIAQVGGGRNLAEAHRPLWIRQNGLSIAVLAYNEFKPRSFEAGPDWPGVAWSEDDRVVADITAARRAGADVIIPFMHWGWERERQPTDRQRQLARLMIDAGADLVVGRPPARDTRRGHLQRQTHRLQPGQFRVRQFRKRARRPNRLAAAPDIGQTRPAELGHPDRPDGPGWHAPPGARCLVALRAGATGRSTSPCASPDIWPWTSSTGCQPRPLRQPLKATGQAAQFSTARAN